MRFNFLGGPGSGKSTTSARVFVELKARRRSVELAQEYVKAWAYMKRQVQPFDQLYLFGKQHHMEYRFLSHGVRNVITDSPTWLSVFYAREYGQAGLAAPLLELCRLYDAQHPCVNIFLSRGEKPYVTEGRYQTEEQARDLDGKMLAQLREDFPQGTLHVIPYYEQAAVLDAVLEHVE